MQSQCLFNVLHVCEIKNVVVCLFLHVFEIKKHAKLLFAQCSPVSYLEKKNKKIKNQTQHHKKEKDIKIITIMKKQNKLNKKT